MYRDESALTGRRAKQRRANSYEPVAAIHDQEVIAIVHADKGAETRARAPPVPSRVTATA